MKNILEEIRNERISQDAKWGEQNHLPIEWVAILMEEVGEASKEAVDFYFKNQPKGLPQIDTNSLEFEEVQLQRLIAYRKEVVQIVAVGVAMLQSFDRGEGKNYLNPKT